MKSPDHQQLMNILDKLATAEKWGRMPRKKGILLKKEVMKSGNMRLILNTKKGEERVYVLKRNKNLYLNAQSLAVSDMVSTSLRRYLGKFYCTRLAQSGQKKIPKEKISADFLLSQYL